MDNQKNKLKDPCRDRVRVRATCTVFIAVTVRKVEVWVQYYYSPHNQGVFGSVSQNARNFLDTAEVPEKVCMFC